MCWTVVCLGVLALASAVSASPDYTIRLKTAEFTPNPKQLSTANAAALAERHILIQFENPIDEWTRQNLENDGIVLLDYIPNYAFTARLNGTIDQDMIDRYAIRWFDGIQPTYKMSPMLEEIATAEWARRGGDRVQFVVVLHPDEDPDFWANQFVTQFGAEIVGIEPSANSLDIVLPEDAYYRLSENDAVLWIKLVNPPQKAFNNNGRTSLKVNILQDPPYDLRGNGISFAVWDAGRADASHPDLTKVVQVTGSTVHYHATHVSGTIAGTGAASGGLYRGMSPDADLASFLWWGSASQATNEYSTAGLFYQARISNNSWGLGVGDPAQSSLCNALMGNYLTECTTIDNIVRGSSGARWTICWSAGNDRSTSSDQCGSLGWTWNTISSYANAKNIITVGAVNTLSDNMTSFSSWGPTDDGRTKPDVVGPGQTLTSTYPGGGYAALQGTSMSSPAIAGTIGLIMEQGKLSFPGRDILPSTFKALAINTATDLGNVGPDYQFGWGKVNALDAVEKIMDGDSSWIEDSIATGEVHLYDLTLLAGDKIQATIVWDDPGATAISGPVLVNDLDLVLIDPSSNIEYPWVLDKNNPGNNATRGEDHLNNNETVTIYAPTPGLWKARVTGTNIPTGPKQKYSLVFTPDNIITPGNTSALAIFDTPDQTIDPGFSTNVDYWVTNVGTAADSVRVTVGDDLGWITSGADTAFTLGVYDSVFFSVTINVPPGALASDVDSVVCQLTSETNPLITSKSYVRVVAGAYYDMAINVPADGTVDSPDNLGISIKVHNTGNDFDDLKITPDDTFGWTFTPQYDWIYLAPGDSGDVNFSIVVPAEEAHNDVNTISVAGTSLKGATTSGDFTLTVNNPNPPPALDTPEDDSFSQDRTPIFTWLGSADSYKLYIATNEAITSIVRTYPGITDNNYTVPDADSLVDGDYWWAVRLYVGADSSSLQRYPFKHVVDNTAPGPVTPTYPVNGAYVGQAQPVFFLAGGGGSIGVGDSPEFIRIQIATDSTFGAVDYAFVGASATSFSIPSPIGQGRWYWRAQQADSAGNESVWSGKAEFLLDSQTPAIPTLTTPANGGSGGGVNVIFKWTTDPPAAWEESPEYYFLQISNASNFFNILHSENVWSTQAQVAAAGLFSEGFTYYWRVRGKDSVGNQSTYSTPSSFGYTQLICGDINSNGAVNISDLTFLIDYLFAIPPGPAPNPTYLGSVNCDLSVNISDVTYLVAYLFGIPAGPAPCCAF
jgi:hypothetical protein